MRLCNLCEALKISRKEGENAAQPPFQAALGGVSIKISKNNFVSSKLFLRTLLVVVILATAAAAFFVVGV